MRVRVADLSDFPALAVLGEEFWKQLDYDEPFSIEHVATLLHRVNESGIILVLEVEGFSQPVGFIGFTIGSLPFADAIQANEVAFYVIPECRKSRGAIMLLKSAEKEAKARGAKYINMISLSCMREDGKDRAGMLYRRLGFEPVETFHRKRL